MKYIIYVICIIYLIYVIFIIYKIYEIFNDELGRYPTRRMRVTIPSYKFLYPLITIALERPFFYTEVMYLYIPSFSQYRSFFDKIWWEYQWVNLIMIIKLINRWNVSDDKLDRKFDNNTKEINDLDNQISEIKGVISRLNGKH